MVGEMFSIEKLISLVTELSIRGRKPKIYFVFITLSNLLYEKHQNISYILFHYENSKQTRVSKNII